MNSSKKAIQAALHEAAFDPRKAGHLHAIVTGNDHLYLIKRAKEFLDDAEQFYGSEKRAKVRDAISLLAYAMTTLPEAPSPVK